MEFERETFTSPTNIKKPWTNAFREIFEKKPDGITLSLSLPRTDEKLRRLIIDSLENIRKKYHNDCVYVFKRLKVLLDYIEGPTLIDSFKHHHDRRAWAKEVRKEPLEYKDIIEELFKRNKFSRHTMTLVLASISTLHELEIVTFPKKLMLKVNIVKKLMREIIMRKGEIRLTSLDIYDELVKIFGAKYTKRVTNLVDNIAREAIEFICAPPTNKD